jgi:hypothetical protein
MGQDHLSTPTVSLTPEALQAMIAAAVTAAIIESKKPYKDPLLLKHEQEQRERIAGYEIEKIKNRRNTQLNCTHEHSKREGGGTQAVWVREENPSSPGFILCQECQGRIRPGVYDVEGYSFQLDRGAIYDTARFNQLFQDCGVGGTFQ